MVTCRAIDRTSDRKTYTLMSTDGKVVTIGIEQLKEEIRSGKLNVVNLTMGVDGSIRFNKNADFKRAKYSKIKNNATYSLFDLVKKADKIDINEVINKAISMDSFIYKIPVTDKVFCSLISEGKNLILCIPNDVRDLGNEIEREDRFIGQNREFKIEVDRGTLTKLKFTKYLQRLNGNIMVVGGSSLVNINFMFAGCVFDSINLKHFDTSNVVNMRGVFCGCSAKEVDLSYLNISNVRSMDWMFADCTIQKGIDISTFKTENVKYMAYMFSNCHSKIKGLSKLSFNSAALLEGMFANTVIDSVRYDVVEERHLSSYLLTMYGMFYNCTANLVDFSGCFINSGFSMTSMFEKSNIKTVTFAKSKFDTTACLDIMFASSKIETVDFSDSDLGKNKRMIEMFADAHIKNVSFARSRFGEKIYNNNMFRDCRVEECIDFSDVYMENYVSESYLFGNCKTAGTIKFFRHVGTV